LGLSDVKSRIIAACNATEYFLASLVAIFIIDRIGRRKLMLFGATGQCITMVLLAVLGSINNPAARVVSAVLLFVFNSVFAVGWLGMTWLYVNQSIFHYCFPFNFLY
jgi:MFS family permease